MDRWLSKSLWWTQKVIYRGASSNDAWSDETISDWNRCIKVCNWHSSYSIGFKWQQTSHFIYLKDFLTSRTKLWNLQQGITSNHLSVGRMATLYPRIATCNNSFIRLQEPHLLPKSKETKSTTSLLVLIPIQIWCKTGAHPLENKWSSQMHCHNDQTYAQKRRTMTIRTLSCYPMTCSST